MNFKKIKLGVVLLGLVFGLGAGINVNAAELITNGGFESKLTGWDISGSPCTPFNGFHHSGTRYAVMGQLENLSDVLSQTVTIPNDIDSATLSYWYNITSEETAINSKFDKLKVTIQDSGNNILDTVDNKSNLDKDNCAVASCYHNKTFNMTKYKGQTVKIHFWATTDDSKQTTFRIDDVNLKVITSNTLPPAKPGNFTLSNQAPICDTNHPEGPAIRLNWNSANGATSYHVYRNGSLYENVATDTTFYNSANVIADRTYTYYIQARNSSGSTNSNTITVNVLSNICDTSSAPQFGNNALSYETPTCDPNHHGRATFRLNWKLASGATSHHLYHNGGNYVGMTGDRTFYRNNSVTVGQTYTYYIQARNASGSTNSNTVSVHVPDDICNTIPSPTKPGNFILSNEAPICDTNYPEGPAIRLNWNSANGATSYHVYRNGNYYIGTATDTTFYNNANVTAGQTYTYYIQARNASGSTNSNTVTVYVPSDICDILPQLLEFDFTSKTINTSQSSQVVTFTFRATDNLSGVKFINWCIDAPSLTQDKCETIYEGLISGDIFDGVYQGTMVFPQHSEAGNWHINHLSVGDEVGNVANFNEQNLTDLGFPTEIKNITGNEDTSSPQLLEFDFTPKTINTSQSSQVVTFTFRATDNLSGAKFINWCIRNPSWSSSFQGQCETIYGNPISGDALNGTYQGIIIFSQYSEMGSWHIDHLSVGDKVGNYKDFKKQDLIDLGFPVEIVNSQVILPQCSDGIDNDGDGYTDYPNDFWCDSPEDNNEQGPTLEFIETVGDFSDGVNPNSGNPESQFTFKVNYTHPDNVEYPVQVNIFDELYDMVPDLSANGNYADGEQYTISMPANWGSDLSVPFYFEAFSEEGIVIRLPEDENEFLYFEVNDDRLPIFPRVTTKTVTDITDTSVKLHGSINPNGLSAKVFFTWGETETSQNPTMTFPEVSMETSVAKFSKTISRLNPNTTYIYRAVGTNVNGTVFGNYLEFTTLAEDESDKEPGSFSITFADTYCDTQDPVGPAVRLEWSESVGAESYEIYRDGVKYTTLSSDNTTFENNAGIVVGEEYEYYVKAVNNVGETESDNRMTVEIGEGVCGTPEQNYEDLIREFEVSRLEVYVADELYYIVSMSCAINIENMTCENSDTPYTIYLDKNNHIVSDSSIVRKIGIIEIARDIDMDEISSKYAALQKIETIQKDLVKKEEMFNSAMDLAKKAVLIEDAIEKSNKVFELSYEIVSMQIEYQETLVILEVGSEDSILILQDVRSSIMLQKTKYINRVRNLDKIAMAKNLFLNLAPTGIVFFQKALIGDPMEAVKTDMDNEYNAAINNYKSALMKYYGQCANIKDYKSASSLISSQKNGITHEKNYLMLHEMIVKNFDKAFMSFYLSFTRDIALGALTGGWSELTTMVGPSLDAMKALDWTLTIRYETALSNGYDGCYLAHHFSGGAINTLRISQEKLSVDTNGLREKIDECNQNIRDNALEIYNQPIKYLEEHWFVKVSIEMDKYLPMIPIELVEPLIDSPVDWITEMLEKADKYYVPTPVGWGAGMFIDSPVELRIIDEYERITGIVDGEVFLEVPYSIYFEENEGFIILNLDNDSEIKFEIKAIDNGVYGIHIYSHSTDTNNSNSIHGKDIPIVLNEIHQYTINWQALASGEQGVTIQIDQDGDGTFEKTITSDATLEASEITGDDSSSENNNIGGGGSVSATLPVDTSIIINNEESDTMSKDVVLTLSASGAMQMAISNSSDFAGVSWEDYETSKEWTLTSDAGEKTVYAKFRSSNGGVSAIVSDDIILNSTGMVKGVTTTEIIDGDIIQCQTSENPFAVYVVKIVGDTKYIRHLVSLEIFNHYRHLKWENLKQVESLDEYSLSSWVRYNTGENNTPIPTDKVYEINGDQTKHWINMIAEQFLTHGGSDVAIYNINQGELDLYITGVDVVISN